MNLLCAENGSTTMFLKLTKRKVFVVFVVLLNLWYFFGLTELQFEDFTYPLEGDISVYVNQLLSNKRPDVEPINSYNYKFDYLPECEPEDLNKKHKKLTIIVKSAVKNYDKREAIRQTWGAQGMFHGVKIRTVFNLGRSSTEQCTEEAVRYGDIIQSDFIDTYYNNTLKTMMGLRYAYQFCPSTDYFILVDDDYYVSMVNALKTFPPNSNITFYSGKVHVDPPVYRNPIRKWYVSTKDYPFAKYPNFVAGGFIMLTKSTLKTFYLASKYTKHFLFDDVFLGIIAYKLQIPPIVNEDCYNDKIQFKGGESYKSVIATHGYDDTEAMVKVWHECRNLGYS